MLILGTFFGPRINQEFHNQTVFVRNGTHFRMGGGVWGTSVTVSVTISTSL